MSEPMRRQAERKSRPRKKLRLKNDNISYQREMTKKLIRKDRKVKTGLLRIFAVYFIACFFILLGSRARLAKKNRELNSLEDQVRVLEMTKAGKKEELEKAIDLDEIKRYATENLHMKYITDENTLDINVDR